MGFSCGIVGLPNVGKSTIFKALSNASVEIASYPFTTINPNLGVVEVPDERLGRIAEVVSPKKIVPTTVEFYDIAGLVKGASHGEGLGNKFLSHIRNVDAIIHVVRAFRDKDIAHIHGRIDPRDDIDVVNMELILSDLEIVERRLQKIENLARSGIKDARREVNILSQVRAGLEKGITLRLQDLAIDEMELIRSLELITIKPVLYVINIDEEDIGCISSETGMIGKIKRHVKEKEKASLIPLCGKLEAEIAELDHRERRRFLEEMGLHESGLIRLIKEGYRLLNLITFYTVVGNKEARAWTVKKETEALKAAGKVHSDFERGFIRVDVIYYEDFIRAGSESKAREMGVLRSEGREYIVRDGDILHFYFNV